MKKQYKSLYPHPVKGKNSRTLNYCGIRCTLEVLGGKWKLLILTHLFRSPVRYADIRKTIPEISERMLVLSLKELEAHGLINRRELSSTPLLVEYAISEYGLSVQPVVEMLHQWGEKHITQYGDLLLG